MNKYQEALIYFCNGCHHEQEEGDYGACKRVEGRCKHYLSLKELVDKEKSPTLEEVKKEWEEKGFEVENNSKKISFRSQKLNTDIYIDKVPKDVQICVCHYNYAQTISFELHQLLTKTFKALGWGGYND